MSLPRRSVPLREEAPRKPISRGFMSVEPSSKGGCHTERAVTGLLPPGERRGALSSRVRALLFHEQKRTRMRFASGDNTRADTKSVRGRRFMKIIEVCSRSPGMASST